MEAGGRAAASSTPSASKAVRSLEPLESSVRNSQCRFGVVLGRSRRAASSHHRYSSTHPAAFDLLEKRHSARSFAGILAHFLGLQAGGLQGHWRTSVGPDSPPDLLFYDRTRLERPPGSLYECAALPAELLGRERRNGGLPGHMQILTRTIVIPDACCPTTCPTLSKSTRGRALAVACDHRP
jgi:hypothetical protein